MAGTQLEVPPEEPSTCQPNAGKREPEYDRRDLDNVSEDELQHVPRDLTERRKVQKAVFENWLVSDRGRKAMKPIEKSDEGPEFDDVEMSIHSLMPKQSSQIIKNPREYQLELFERAQLENTIAVLDTGSGKTLIAVLLLKWMIDQELERRMIGEQPKISFFLVASVTLVFQHFAVLEQNMDHKVAKVCGADGVDNWNKAKWDRLLSENMAIVATADILYKCLARSFTNMKKINLLIFDEAHHAKKDHSFARIMKDFYITETDPAARPRIFGMTASPVDAKTDIAQAANELETILNCKIATTNNTSLSDAIKKPVERMLMYNPLPAKSFETPFSESIQTRFPNVTNFRQQYAKAADVARHLGRWCADQYLMRALSESKLQRYKLESERTYYGTTQSSNSNGISALDTNQTLIREVFEFVAAEESKYVSIGQNDFSSKVLSLQYYLNQTFERPSEHRCIIFVEARNTAKLLAEAFKHIGTQNLRPGFLVGAKNPEIDEDNVTFLAQVMALMKFRKGEINCLFATSVAEEGLDVPDCNLVVRFDMYRTMIQYIQSRGRARKANSTFIHMLEKDNGIHKQLFHEVRCHEKAMLRFCHALPEDRRLQGNEDCLEGLMAKEKALRIYTEEITGAKLTYGNALACLANFVSVIPKETEEIMHPTYVIRHQGMKFIAEVLLPGNAPISSVSGHICTRKGLAKRSAAFEACIELRKKQYLDEYLMPVYQKKLPAMRNALLALNMKKTNQYVMRTKPSMWKETRGILPNELFVTIIDFLGGLERPHQPLALLTRTRLPNDFPDFPVYLNDGRATLVRSRTLHRTFKLDGQLELFTKFTFRVFQDVFSKTYEYEPAKLSYWIAPARMSLGGHTNAVENSEIPENLIDWDLLNEVYNHEEYKWTSESPPAFLLNRFLVDKWDGSRKFYSKAVCTNLKPLDPVPEEAARHKWMESILDYSNSMFKNTREKFKNVWDLEQPVILAEKDLQRRNMLSMPDWKKVELKTDAWLCPEPLKISVLTPAVATSCMVFPAIIHRLDSYLIAMETCVLVGVDCKPALALAAITKDSESSSKHETQDYIKFQRGMGENYERLEFIGDTFLKAATTISTFIQNPKDSEFECHVKRMLMLCNQNLFHVGVELKLYEYIRSISFSRRAWYPEGLKLIEGKGIGKQEGTSVPKHSLGEKTIADVSEALIGASYLSHNLPGETWYPSQWDDAVHAVTKLVNSPDHTMHQWSDYISAYEKPSYQTGEVSASQRDMAKKVEQEHGYHFNYPRLLRSAFIHPSQPLMYENVPNYQRLEFLGDALLDLASITYLFYRFPDKDPQWLTEHKMAMVSNKFLGAVCVNIGFHKHLRHNSAKLQHQITEYAVELLEAKRLAGNARDYWITVSDPPKCLADIVESFVGALFIDSNFDYNSVQRFFEKHIKWYFEDVSIYNSFASNHPCTLLHKLLQTTYGCADYRVMAKELPSIDATERSAVVAVVMIHNDIISHSQGKSGRHARLKVAQTALGAIEGLAPFEFRSRFGCNCHLTEGPLEGAMVASKEVLSADCNI